MRYRKQARPIKGHFESSSNKRKTVHNETKPVFDSFLEINIKAHYSNHEYFWQKFEYLPT